MILNKLNVQKIQIGTLKSMLPIQFTTVDDKTSHCSKCCVSKRRIIQYNES